MDMVWHQPFQKDPAHGWLREQLEAAVGGIARARR
ncbi:hypothetical protein BH11PSE4_BH11PSE4_28140 [soil metagenome]